MDLLFVWSAFFVIFILVTMKIVFISLSLVKQKHHRLDRKVNIGQCFHILLVLLKRGTLSFLCLGLQLNWRIYLPSSCKVLVLFPAYQTNRQSKNPFHLVILFCVPISFSSLSGMVRVVPIIDLVFHPLYKLWSQKV